MDKTTGTVHTSNFNKNKKHRKLCLKTRPKKGMKYSYNLGLLAVF